MFFFGVIFFVPVDLELFGSMILDTISSNTSTTFSSYWGFSVSSATLAGLSVKSSLKDSTKPSAGRGITL